MDIDELLDTNELAAAIAAGDINARSRDDLTIYCYSKQAMVNNRFDSNVMRQCRGLIIANGKVVARPWAKFFNYGQPGADVIDPDLPVEITDKIDGSLGIMFKPGRITTKGSFDSVPGKLAQDMLTMDYGMFDYPDDFTPLVEIVHPDARIVLDYGQDKKLVLLGGVWHDGRYVGPLEARDIIEAYCGHVWPDVTTVFEGTFHDALAMHRPNAEGVVVRQGNKMVKIKQADYLRLHKFVSNLTPKAVWESMVNGTYDDFLANAPDEFIGFIKQCRRDIDGERLALGFSAFAVASPYMVDPTAEVFEFTVDRKTFAQAVNGPLAKFAFLLYDNNTEGFNKAILKAAKPC